MRTLTIEVKLRVVTLFLSGLPYDEIVEQVGISKGSVVGIVDDFREGRLPWPSGKTEFIDEVRRLVVDLRRKNTSVSQLRSCMKIHDRLEEMQVGTKQMEGWLDLFQQLALSHASDGQFVEIVSELVRLSSDTGLGYTELVEDHERKVDQSRHLQEDIEKYQVRLNEARLRYETEISEAQKRLDSIEESIAVSEKTHAARKSQLASELNECMAQHRVSWEKVNLACSLFGDRLSDVGLTETAIDQLSKEIVAAGSIVNMEKSRQSSVNQLQKRARTLAADLEEKMERDRNFDIEIQRKMRDSQKMNTELGEKRSELSGIKELIQGLKDDIAVVKAVIRFLAAPDMLADSDFSGLLGVFLDARRDRMVMSARLHDVMECPENPVILGRFESALMMYDQKLNGFRGRLAFYLLPLLE